MSYKQRALAAIASVNAIDAGTYGDSDMYYMDYCTPKGFVWSTTGDHMSWIRSETLTDCWKQMIETVKSGLEVCENRKCDWDCGSFATEAEAIAYANEIGEQQNIVLSVEFADGLYWVGE